MIQSVSTGSRLSPSSPRGETLRKVWFIFMFWIFIIDIFCKACWCFPSGAFVLKTEFPRCFILVCKVNDKRALPKKAFYCLFLRLLDKRFRVVSLNLIFPSISDGTTAEVIIMCRFLKKELAPAGLVHQQQHHHQQWEDQEDHQHQQQEDQQHCHHQEDRQHRDREVAFGQVCDLQKLPLPSLRSSSPSSTRNLGALVEVELRILGLF